MTQEIKKLPTSPGLLLLIKKYVNGLSIYRFKSLQAKQSREFYGWMGLMIGCCTMILCRSWEVSLKTDKEMFSFTVFIKIHSPFHNESLHSLRWRWDALIRSWRGGKPIGLRLAIIMKLLTSLARRKRFCRFEVVFPPLRTSRYAQWLTYAF